MIIKFQGIELDVTAEYQTYCPHCRTGYGNRVRIGADSIKKILGHIQKCVANPNNKKCESCYNFTPHRQYIRSVGQERCQLLGNRKKVPVARTCENWTREKKHD